MRAPYCPAAEPKHGSVAGKQKLVAKQTREYEQADATQREAACLANVTGRMPRATRARSASSSDGKKRARKTLLRL